MLQASDTAPPNAHLNRPDWIALLARAPIELLENVDTCTEGFEQHFVRQPETGLMMIQGRAGGSGARFNLGEVTVTRCALRAKRLGTLETIGISYVLGRSRHKAHLAALADALLQMPDLYPLLHASVLAPIRRYLSDEIAVRSARADSTKVDFFTVAREAGAMDSNTGSAR